MNVALEDFRYQSMFPRVLMISTGHLTARTAKFLRDHDAADWPCLGGHFGDVGWMLWVDEGASGMAPHLPRDLSEVFEYAANENAVIVIFQDVSPVVPELPIYGEHDYFHADEFLDRPRKSWQELEDEAALASLDILSQEEGFQETRGYFVEAMENIVASVVAHSRHGKISSFPYEQLQKLSDLASTFRLYATFETQVFQRVALAIGNLEGRLDTLLEITAFDDCGPEARIRNVLEGAQFRLKAAEKLFKASRWRREGHLQSCEEGIRRL